MRSSCGVRKFPVDPLQLFPDRSRNFPRSPLSKSDTPDMGRIEVQLARNAGEYAVEPRNPQNVSVGVILVGHNSAGQNQAQLLPQKYNRGNNEESTEKEEPRVPYAPEGASEPRVPRLPEWAVHVGKLLKGKRLTQATFAAKMNVTQSSVSNWISGKKEPKPEIYFRMAKLWPDAVESPFFLKRAADLSGSFQVQGQEEMFGSKKKAVRRVKFGKLTSEAVEIPLLKDAAATGSPRQINQKDIDDVLPLPGSLCPHPDDIVCIKVKGDSMSPLLEEGYIVAIDTAQTDRARLHSQMVAARDPEGGVTIKWLRMVGKQEILLPQNTSKRHQPVILSPLHEEETGWAIVGKVLWWIGMPS